MLQREESRSAPAWRRVLDARDRAVEGEEARSVDVDVVADPALDLRRNEVARDAEIDRRNGGIVQQDLLGLLQQLRAQMRIAGLVRLGSQGVEFRIGIEAVVHVRNPALEYEEVVL